MENTETIPKAGSTINLLPIILIIAAVSAILVAALMCCAPIGGPDRTREKEKDIYVSKYWN